MSNESMASGSKAKGKNARGAARALSKGGSLPTANNDGILLQQQNNDVPMPAPGASSSVVISVDDRDTLRLQHAAPTITQLRDILHSLTPDQKKVLAQTLSRFHGVDPVAPGANDDSHLNFLIDLDPVIAITFSRVIVNAATAGAMGMEVFYSAFLYMSAYQAPLQFMKDFFKVSSDKTKNILKGVFTGVLSPFVSANYIGDLTSADSATDAHDFLPKIKDWATIKETISSWVGFRGITKLLAIPLSFFPLASADVLPIAAFFAKRVASGEANIIDYISLAVVLGLGSVYYIMFTFGMMDDSYDAVLKTLAKPRPVIQNFLDEPAIFLNEVIEGLVLNPGYRAVAATYITDQVLNALWKLVPQSAGVFYPSIAVGAYTYYITMFSRFHKSYKENFGLVAKIQQLRQKVVNEGGNQTRPYENYSAYTQRTDYRGLITDAALAFVLRGAPAFLALALLIPVPVIARVIIGVIVGVTLLAINLIADYKLRQYHTMLERVGGSEKDTRALRDKEEGTLEDIRALLSYKDVPADRRALYASSKARVSQNYGTLVGGRFVPINEEFTGLKSAEQALFKDQNKARGFEQLSDNEKYEHVKNLLATMYNDVVKARYSAEGSPLLIFADWVTYFGRLARYTAFYTFVGTDVSELLKLNLDPLIVLSAAIFWGGGVFKNDNRTYGEKIAANMLRIAALYEIDAAHNALKDINIERSGGENYALLILREIYRIFFKLVLPFVAIPQDYSLAALRAAAEHPDQYAVSSSFKRGLTTVKDLVSCGMFRSDAQSRSETQALLSVEDGRNHSTVVTVDTPTAAAAARVSLTT